MRRAMVRVAHGLAPTIEVGKDCIVIEANFELVRVPRARGFEKKVVFLTTNVSDYSAARGSIKCTRTWFESLQIEYATSFGLAGHQGRAQCSEWALAARVTPRGRNDPVRIERDG